MGKNKNKNFQPKPSVPPTGSRPEPTPEQLVKLAAAANQVTDLTAMNGPVSYDGVSEPVGPTLAESLRRLEGLLNGARAHYDKARERESANKAEAERLATQRRDQEEELRQNRKVSDEEVARAKKAVEQQRLVLDGRIDDVGKRETEVAKKEASFAEQGARLAERELNAENGFRAEKALVLKPLDDELKRLRDERDRLATKCANENTQRTENEAEARRRLDEDLASQRRDKLEALRTELASEREKDENAWDVELERRRSRLDEREAALDTRDQELIGKLTAHRGEKLDLQVEKEIHNEDRRGLDRKVERLVTERTENLRSEAEGLKKLLEDARNTRDAHWKDLESRKELDRRFGDRTPEDILFALTAAEAERDTFKQQLRERPDARVGERLAQLEKERSEWLDEKAVLQGDLAKAQAELATRRLSAIELEALKKQKEALEVHKQLLDGAVDELRARVDELTRQEDRRNPMTALTSLDEKEELLSEVRTKSPLGKATPTLKDFALDLRHRIAQGVKGRTLYYAERDVRAFLGGLAMTRLMLLQGISGTGKSSLPKAFAEAVAGGYQDIAVQAGWRDRQDLIGYYNAFHRHYYASDFLQALYKAGTPAWRDRPFMMVMEEMNLSRPEHFFADFIDALEKPISERSITLVTDPVANAPKLIVDGRRLPIPPNVWFIGTANHDESTAEFADKTYDRAHVMEMPRKTEAAHFAVDLKDPHNKPISYSELERAFEAAAKNKDAEIRKATTWLRKAPFADDLQRRFRVGWGNRLEQQLARYLPVVVDSGGTVGEAMDHLLVTKVLRKLKDRHDVRATALEELREKLKKAWGNLDEASEPERCFDLIDGEITAKKGEELA